MIETHPLNADQLVLLFGLGDTYIVPWQQHSVKMCALVLFNPHGRRKGIHADKEATLMESHLRKANFTTNKFERKSAFHCHNDTWKGRYADG